MALGVVGAAVEDDRNLIVQLHTDGGLIHDTRLLANG
jgi:hypothetical protein